MSIQELICRFFLEGVAPQDIHILSSDFFYMLHTDPKDKYDMWWFFDVSTRGKDLEISCTLFEGNFRQWKKYPADWDYSKTSAIDKVNIFVRNMYGGKRMTLNPEEDWKIEYVYYEI
jgi:hypothetical protein